MIPPEIGGFSIEKLLFVLHEDLLSRIKNGEEGARECLLIKYNKIAWSLAIDYYYRYKKSGYTADDFYSIILSAINDSIDTFDYSRKSFFSYAITIANNDVRRFIKKHYQEIDNRSKLVSLDNSYENGSSLHDYLTGESEEPRYMLYDSFISIVENEKFGFSKREKNIIELYLLGYEIKEIAELLNISLNACYRHYNKAVQRIGVLLKEKKHRY